MSGLFHHTSKAQRKGDGRETGRGGTTVFCNLGNISNMSHWDDGFGKAQRIKKIVSEMLQCQKDRLNQHQSTVTANYLARR